LKQCYNVEGKKNGKWRNEDNCYELTAIEHTNKAKNTIYAKISIALAPEIVCESI
jgi:hypothetical protein